MAGPRARRQIAGVRILRACPRTGCYRVVPRLHFVRVSVGLEDQEPGFMCDDCLEHIRDRAATDPAIAITIVESRRLE